MTILKFPIEAGHIMMFARSVGDANRIYYSEEYAKTTEPGAITAPPTFVQSSVQYDPNYFLRPQIGEPWFGSGKTPTGRKSSEQSGGGSGLHAEQRFEYHRHPKAGDMLTSEVKPGESWTKASKRAGTLKFSSTITEYRDEQGELVITATAVAVVTERPVDQ